MLRTNLILLSMNYTIVVHIKHGPLITDGRNSNEMGFSKISFGRIDYLGIPNLNDMNFRS